MTATRPPVAADRTGSAPLEPAPAADAELAGRANTDPTLDAPETLDLRRADSTHALQAPERAGHAARAHALDIASLATRFAARIAGGASQFSIRLDPPELGRVDVRLEVSADGLAQARLVAERPEALAELTRHARALERELAEAGVELTEGGLSFELAGRSNPDARGRGEGFSDAPRAPTRALEVAAPPEVIDALAEIDDAYGFTIIRRSRLDLRI